LGIGFNGHHKCEEDERNTWAHVGGSRGERAV
jgi:hypothetical protein